MFKGGNLEIESYEIKKENAEFIEDLKENKFIFNYKNLNTNKIKIEFNVKAKILQLIIYLMEIKN